MRRLGFRMGAQRCWLTLTRLLKIGPTINDSCRCSSNSVPRKKVSSSAGELNSVHSRRLALRSLAVGPSPVTMAPYSPWVRVPCKKNASWSSASVESERPEVLVDGRQLSAREKLFQCIVADDCTECG